MDLHPISSCPCRASTMAGADAGGGAIWNVLGVFEALWGLEVRCSIVRRGTALRYARSKAREKLLEYLYRDSYIILKRH